MVELDGSGSSDPDGDTFTYSWSFVTKPSGSNAVLSDTTIDNPTFEADIDGDYVIQLIVNDGIVDSAADTVSITAFASKIDLLVAIGDSITKGFGDNIDTDNTSLDGRNTGGGFEPILNDLLTVKYNYPHDVQNEGKIGEFSAGALDRLPGILNSYPNASTYLIMYGTNDSTDQVPSGLGLQSGVAGYDGTFKDNMQQMIDLITVAGKKPLLAKIPRTLGDTEYSAPYSEPVDNGANNIYIQEYNQVIDELVEENNISVTPPDFYNKFKDTYGTNGDGNTDGYQDNLHPDGIGYNSMAEWWRDALIE